MNNNVRVMTIALAICMLGAATWSKTRLDKAKGNAEAAAHSFMECQRLLSQLKGADHMAPSGAKPVTSEDLQRLVEESAVEAQIDRGSITQFEPQSATHADARIDLEFVTMREIVLLVSTLTRKNASIQIADISLVVPDGVVDLASDPLAVATEEVWDAKVTLTQPNVLPTSVAAN